MRRKAFDTTIRPLPEREGVFTAYASCFGNRDLHGDVVVKGAFAKTLAQWAEKGRPIPLLYGHDFSDPELCVGKVLTASEDDTGLLVTASLDLDNPKAAQVHRLMKDGRLAQMSFAFDVLDSERVKAGWDLKELRLHEVSVVPIGANPDAEVLDVKAGRAISARNEAALRDALDAVRAAGEALLAVLPADDPPEDEPPPEPEAQAPPKSAPPARLYAAELHLLDIHPEETN
ncbi:phage prohead protease, HK97 family [Segniliparus rotundus DSM 44985]|uniref:Phage prohead protease, HK97 family n=1 Tax=Segniliparus rotundus (strain ATCC BAA-972 / CDC 1076 / CIP 108378 / DSM 44985 / JCM 13578) TaxID=640132 RepID=D6ZFB3_SEGRD|nr:HK97 family phage prohead protease [Segniliparus rotundus]ADG97637.1 phage prohead protease, HK97 family [Segniliparus rotundus DSM 44985]